MSHPSPVWLCFAQLGLWVSVRLLEIGFVFPGLFTGPTHHNSFFAKYLSFQSAPAELALFRTIDLSDPPPPRCPIPPRFGFVLHNRSSPRPEAGGSQTGDPAMTLLYSIRNPKSEIRNSSSPRPHVSSFRFQIINQRAVPDRVSLYPGAVLHESCRNSVRTTLPRRATLCAQRDKRFFTRGVFYLFNCCTNVIVHRVVACPHAPGIWRFSPIAWQEKRAQVACRDASVRLRPKDTTSFSRHAIGRMRKMPRGLGTEAPRAPPRFGAPARFKTEISPASAEFQRTDKGPQRNVAQPPSAVSCGCPSRGRLGYTLFRIFSLLSAIMIMDAAT